MKRSVQVYGLLLFLIDCCFGQSATGQSNALAIKTKDGLRHGDTPMTSKSVANLQQLFDRQTQVPHQMAEGRQAEPQQQIAPETSFDLVVNSSESSSKNAILFPAWYRVVN